MDELRAKLPDNEDTFLGLFLSGPLYHEPTNEQIGYRRTDYVDDTPYYSAKVRAIASKNLWAIQFSAAEIILASGEAVPVNITGIGYAHPSSQAVQAGEGASRDVSIRIDANSLSQEQATQARFLIQQMKR